MQVRLRLRSEVHVGWRLPEHGEAWHDGHLSHRARIIIKTGHFELAASTYMQVELHIAGPRDVAVDAHVVLAFEVTALGGWVDAASRKVDRHVDIVLLLARLDA